jgi:hypothetical protein
MMGSSTRTGFVIWTTFEARKQWISRFADYENCQLPSFPTQMFFVPGHRESTLSVFSGRITTGYARQLVRFCEKVKEERATATSIIVPRWESSYF